MTDLIGSILALLILIGLIRLIVKVSGCFLKLILIAIIGAILLALFG